MSYLAGIWFPTRLGFLVRRSIDEGIHRQRRDVTLDDSYYGLLLLFEWYTYLGGGVNPCP